MFSVLTFILAFVPRRLTTSQGRLFCGPKFRERGFWISPPVGGYPAINVVATEGFLSSEISDSETVLSTLVHFFYSRFERTATSLLALALARELWWLPRAGHGSGAAAAGPVG